MRYIQIAKMLFFLIIASLMLYISLQNKQYRQDLENAVTNEKAYMSENSRLKNENIVFKFTIDQFNTYKDSITEEIHKAKQQLNIKDKNLQTAQYINSIITKTDTVVLKDTIFKNNVNIDTIIKDDWHSINLKMKYPDTIITQPEFISDKYIFTHSKKETIKPKSKWWIVRLFQKKHTVVEIDVIEKNPYIVTNRQRFIEIIK